MLTRQQAIDLFGSAQACADALGYKSRHAVYMWPKDQIPQEPFLRIRYVLKPECFDGSGALLTPIKRGVAA